MVLWDFDMNKPIVAVHKFSSCDGCQLAFLNAGEALLALAELVEIKHFVEAGFVDEEAVADIAFVEGSISTSAEEERIKAVRSRSKFLVTIGACATAGGIQALRNINDADGWKAAVYAQPEYISSLTSSTPVAEHVRVDFELWGCPVSTKQVVAVVRALLFGVTPVDQSDSLCLECKRSGNVCVLVTKREPCMGPVTRMGCGALCPQFGRACYACYGPAENPNGNALGQRFTGLGLPQAQVAQRFSLITSHAEAFAKTRVYFEEKSSD